MIAYLLMWYFIMKLTICFVCPDLFKQKFKSHSDLKYFKNALLFSLQKPDPVSISLTSLYFMLLRKISELFFKLLYVLSLIFCSFTF